MWLQPGNITDVPSNINGHPKWHGWSRSVEKVVEFYIYCIFLVLCCIWMLDMGVRFKGSVHRPFRCACPLVWAQLGLEELVMDKSLVSAKVRIVWDSGNGDCNYSQAGAAIEFCLQTIQLCSRVNWGLGVSNFVHCFSLPSFSCWWSLAHLNYRSPSTYVVGVSLKQQGWKAGWLLSSVHSVEGFLWVS